MAESQAAEKEEFRNYLEKSGVIDSLTKGMLCPFLLVFPLSVVYSVEFIGDGRLPCAIKGK